MVNLREMTFKDKDRVRGWRNLPEVSKYMYNDHLISIEEHDKWYKQISDNESCKYWIIECDAKDVGVANLYNIDRKNSNCFWAFYIADPNVRGKGVGGFVEYFVLNYVFEKLMFNKLNCEVLEFNKPVISMHKRFGFKEEGLFRQHIKKKTEFHDVVRLSMLKHEHDTMKSDIEEVLRIKGLI